MTHNDIRHKLSEYIDGSVTPGEKTAIDEHLTTCTECSDALAELRKTIEAVRQIEEVDAPAWMTQKIMAKVREEQEARKGLWRRALTFFTMRYPIQALTVLFMAVTAYYLYSSINPAQKYSEEPGRMLAKKEAPEVGAMQEERMAVREAAPEQKLAPQKPGYKSLDMKYSYEKPAAPVPQEQPAASAPAPAKREAFTSAKDEADLEKRAKAPEAAAPSLMMEQAAPAGAARSRRDELEPPQLSFTSAKPTLKARPATYLKLGAYSIELEKTTLMDVVNKVGAGTLHHRGDAGDSLYWICYDASNYRLWLLSSELGGPEHVITGFHARSLIPHETSHNQCQLLPQDMQAAKIDRSIWIGMTTEEIQAKLGAPSQTTQYILEYLYLEQVKGPKNDIVGDEMNLLKIFFRNNRTVELQATKATTN